MKSTAIEILERTDHANEYLLEVGRALTEQPGPALDKLPCDSEEWRSFQRERAEAAERLLPQVTREMDAFFAAVTELDTSLTPDERSVCVGYAKERIQPFFFQSPFFRRTVDKPLGYPGDYMTVEMLFDNKPQGETPLGALLARYALDTGPARAHRARQPWVIQHLRQESRQEAPEVLSFACGPERILREYLAGGGDCQITLCDADERALKYARKKIEDLEQRLGRKPNVRAIQISAFTLLRRDGGVELLRRESPPGGCDFVLVLGLLDYLNADVSARFVANLTQVLKPGGYCMLTNVHVKNPWRSLMEYVADWFVHHRSMEELQEIATRRSNLSTVSLTTDETGVNAFYIGQKT